MENPMTLDIPCNEHTLIQTNFVSLRSIRFHWSGLYWSGLIRFSLIRFVFCIPVRANSDCKLWIPTQHVEGVDWSSLLWVKFFWWNCLPADHKTIRQFSPQNYYVQTWAVRKAVNPSVLKSNRLIELNQFFNSFIHLLVLHTELQPNDRLSENFQKLNYKSTADGW